MLRAMSCRYCSTTSVTQCEQEDAAVEEEEMDDAEIDEDEDDEVRRSPVS